MAIASAVQRGSFVYVYNERGATLTTLPAGNKQGDGLHGFTSTTVSVRRGNSVYVYDEKGCTKTILPAK